MLQLELKAVAAGVNNMLDYWEEELKTAYGHAIMEDYTLVSIEGFIRRLLEEQKKKDNYILKDELAKVKVYNQQCIQQLKLEFEADYQSKKENDTRQDENWEDDGGRI